MLTCTIPYSLLFRVFLFLSNIWNLIFGIMTERPHEKGPGGRNFSVVGNMGGGNLALCLFCVLDGVWCLLVLKVVLLFVCVEDILFLGFSLFFLYFCFFFVFFLVFFVFFFCFFFFFLVLGWFIFGGRSVELLFSLEEKQQQQQQQQPRECLLLRCRIVVRVLLESSMC